MFIREKMGKSKKLSLILAVAFLIVAAIVLTCTYWPQKKANLSMAFFSDDDGQTWFTADTSNLAPFNHNGKTAVMAEIFTYDNGNKKFCGYLQEYNPDARNKLEAAFADARAHGQPIGSVPLFHDQGFMQSAMEIKKPGPNPWIASSDPKAGEVFNVHSPDGSAVDQYFVY